MTFISQVPERQEVNERESLQLVRPVDYIPSPYQPIFNFPYFNEMQHALLHQVFETDVSILSPVTLIDFHSGMSRLLPQLVQGRLSFLN
jgi:hypothetical protein